MALSKRVREATQAGRFYEGRPTPLREDVDGYLAAADPADLYRRILQRWEDDYGRELVRNSLSLLWAARRGLPESELLDLLH